MRLIILGHIIGDFYLQTDKMAEKKKKSMKYMFAHCLVYTVPMMIIIFLLSNSIIQTLQIAGTILITHLGLDTTKNYLDGKYQNYEYAFFILNQVFHVIMLLCVYCFFYSELHSGLYNAVLFSGVDVRRYMLITAAFLICWKPAAIFVSLVFKMIPETIESADEIIEDRKQEKKSKISDKEAIKNKMLDCEGVKIGSWIGILEREIILILGLLGQFGAIGFVLTAKSLARFKQLENKAFAEKYLVGTLLSALIAILCIVMCLM